jgi:hypothetical protein
MSSGIFLPPNIRRMMMAIMMISCVPKTPNKMNEEDIK